MKPLWIRIAKNGIMVMKYPPYFNDLVVLYAIINALKLTMVIHLPCILDKSNKNSNYNKWSHC